MYNSAASFKSSGDVSRVMSDGDAMSTTTNDNFNDLINEELGQLDKMVSQYSRPSFLRSKSRRKSVTIRFSKNSQEIGQLDEDNIAKLRRTVDIQSEVDVEVERMQEEEEEQLDGKEIEGVIARNWRKSLVSGYSDSLSTPASLFSVAFEEEGEKDEEPPVTRKKVNIAEDADNYHDEERKLSVDLLEEDEEGHMVHINEIKQQLKTRVFADGECEGALVGELERRKARNLKFDPSLLLSHYTVELLFARDEHGWAPIHYCAYRGFLQCITIMAKEIPAMIEYRSKGDGLNTTPFLLAVMSLNLDSVKLLVKLGANVAATDMRGHNAVELCAFKQAVELVEFFLALEHPRLSVWRTLVASLASHNNEDALATAKTLRILTEIHPPWAASCYWKDLHAHKVTKSFGSIIVGDYSVNVKEETLMTFLNIIEARPIRTMAVEKDNIIPSLSQLLVCDSSRLSDLSAVCLKKLLTTRKYLTMALGADLMELGVQMLRKHKTLSSLKKALDLMAHSIRKYKPFCEKFREVEGSFQTVVDLFVNNTSKSLAFSLLGLVESAMIDQPLNQDLFMAAGLGPHLVRLTKAQNRKLMIVCMTAIKAMARDNHRTQKYMVDLGVVPTIMTLLKKTRYLTIQEITADTLWTIGGKDVERIWWISEGIGVKVLIEFVESHSRILELIGAEGLAMLNKAPLGVHDAYFACMGTQILTRLLSRTKSQVTLHAAIRAIRYSCYKAAMVNHRGNQRLAVGDYTIQGCLGNVFDLIEKNDSWESEIIKAECVVVLASMVLTNSLALKEIMANKRFSYCLAIRLLESPDENIRALAGKALAHMCYNTIGAQAHIASFGGIFYADFKKWMTEAESDLNRSHFAFQLVILARVFPDVTPALAAAEGIVQLHELLELPETQDHFVEAGCNAVIRETCNYIAALCHSRPGIPDSFVAIGTLESLSRLLLSPYEQNRAFAAIAIGYLSFQASAKRWILRKFRQDTYLLDILVHYSQDNKCNPSLLESWRYLEYVGLPPKNMTRGDMIRIRTDQMLSEPRPHILTGVEDPHSGAIGASTYEKDDYDDDLVLVDEAEERKKIVSTRPEVVQPLDQEEPTARGEVPCIDRAQAERERKEAEYLEGLLELEALEEEEEDDEEGDEDENEEEEDENPDDDDDDDDDGGGAGAAAEAVEAPK